MRKDLADLVGVLLRYSNYSVPMFKPGNTGLQRSLTLQQQAQILDPDEPAVDPDRVSTRLVVTDVLKADVLARYIAGQSRREIATALSIGQTTVIKIVRDSGAAVRFPRLTREQTAEICTLFRAGMSQVEIARRFDRDPGNIWHVLERAGLVGGRRD